MKTRLKYHFSRLKLEILKFSEKDIIKLKMKKRNSIYGETIRNWFMKDWMNDILHINTVHVIEVLTDLNSLIGKENNREKFENKLEELVQLTKDWNNKNIYASI